MGRLLALLGALIAAALIGWTLLRPPAPQPTTAPPTGFSAERAMADVSEIARAPHPVGSEANRRVRDYLVARMTALGLAPQVRPGVGLQDSKWAPGFLIGGRVENIVGVLPGRDRNAPAVALMAHYDSVPGSPGAADDAVGVASALEAVRAIKAGGVPARDVMLVITDGEEAGLLGANAFFRRDPLAKRVGFLVNMEARGSSGRVQMFETGPENGEAIALLQKNARRPQASSLSTFVYERMPNDTDFSEVKRAKVAGLNFAFAGRQFDYHSPTSTPALQDRGALQDMGDQVLAVARAAATAPALPKPAPDLVYNVVFGDLIVAYPPLVGWLVLAAAAALIAVGVRRARRIDPFPWLDLARGAGAAVFAVAGVCTVEHFARRVTGAAMGYFEQRVLLAQNERWETAAVLMGLGFLIWAIAELARGRRNVAFVPLAAGIASSAFGGFDKVGLIMGVVACAVGLLAYGRPVTRPGAWTGVLVLGLVVTGAIQAYAPPAAVVFAWPLLLASIGAAATAMATRTGYRSLGALALLAAVGCGWIAGVAHAGFISLDLAELLGLSALLAAMLIWPLGQPEEGAPPARLAGPLLLAAGFVVLLAVRLNAPWDARHPRLSYVAYHVDQDAGRAWRLSRAAERSAWSDQVLKADGGAVQRQKHWAYYDTMDAAPAQGLQETAPAITATPDGDDRQRIVVAADPATAALLLRLKPTQDVVLASVDGVAVNLPMKAGKVTRLRWSGAPTVELVVDKRNETRAPVELEIAYAATLPRWPAGAKPLPARPKDVMPFDTSDSTLVTGTRRQAW